MFLNQFIHYTTKYYVYISISYTCYQVYLFFVIIYLLGAPNSK